MSSSQATSESILAPMLRPLETHPSTCVVHPQATLQWSVKILESTKEHGHRYYIIDVNFEAPRNNNLANVGRIPGATSHKTRRIQLLRRFSDFVNLRYELYHYARLRHTNTNVPCRFCAKIIEHCILDYGQPSLLTKIVNSEDGRRRLLDRYTKKIVELTLCAVTSSNPQCAGQKYIPLIIKRFLSPDDNAGEPQT